MDTYEYGTSSIVLDSTIGLGVIHPVALSFLVTSVVFSALDTIKVRFSLAPNVSDATTSGYYSIPGVTIKAVYKVPDDANLFIVQATTDLAPSSYALTVSSSIRPATGSLTLQSPYAFSFTVGQSNATPVNGGATNISSEDVVSPFFNPAYRKHKNWKTITQTLSVGDASVAQVANSALAQAYLASASGAYLEKRGLEYGVKKPNKTWISDDLFRSLAISVINQKMTGQAFLSLLEIVYGSKAVRGCIATSLKEPYYLFDGGWLQFLVDEKYLVDVVFDKEDFDEIALASAQELASVITASMGVYGYAQVTTDPSTKEQFVEVYSGSKGLGSSIRVTQGTAQPVLEFPTNLFPNAEAGVIWSVDKLPLGKAKYFCNSTAQFNLGLVDTGDYINILDSAFSVGNRGSFVITDTGTGAGLWAFTGGLVTPRGDHTTTLLSNGKVLIAGGYNGDYLNKAELYDPLLGTFSATGDMVNARAGHCSTLLNNGKVLITGGKDQSGPLDSAELYDVTAGTFTATGDMVTGRGEHTATLLSNSKVLIAGGFNTDYLLSAELYNPATGTFAATGNMTAKRYGCTATLLANNKVLVAGGENSTGILSSAELYDATAGTFTATGNMVVDREFHTATRLLTGEVLLAGGVDGGYLSSAELYEPTAGTFAITGSMANMRCNHTATLLSNGDVLVAGGFGSETPGTAEIYSSGFWSLSSSLTVYRWGHTSTLLDTGTVLVIGGFGSGESPGSAEILDEYGTYIEVTNPDVVDEVVTTVSDLGVTVFAPTKKTVYSNPNWVVVTQATGESLVTLPVTAQIVSRTYSDAAYLRENDLQPIQSISRDMEGLTSLTTSEPHGLATGDWFEILETKPTYSARPIVTAGSPSGSLVDELATGTSDATSRSWISVDTTRPANFARAIRDFNGNVWVVGGVVENVPYNQNNLAIFQAQGTIDSTGVRQNSYTWQNFSEALIQPLGSALCVLDTAHHYGQVLVTGGTGVSNVGTTLYLDFSNGIISKTVATSISAAVTDASMTYLTAPISKAVLIGGRVSGLIETTVRLFNPELTSPTYLGTWTDSSYPLITARYQHQSIKIGQDSILVIGGRADLTYPYDPIGAASNIDAFAMGEVLNSCEIVHTAGATTQAPSMTWARFAFGMTELPDGRILVVGGVGYKSGVPFDSSVSNRQGELKSVEIYDPSFNTWLVLPNTLESHSYCVCEYVASENKVFVFGGYESRLVEYLDLKDMRWRRLPDLMPTIRVFGAGALAGDDVPVLSGGSNILPDTGLTTDSAVSLPGSASLGISAYSGNSKGLNGAFKAITSGSQTLTFESDRAFTATTLGNLVATKAANNPEINGPFIYDRTGVSVTGVSATTTSDIGTGVGKDLVGINSSTSFPDSGWVVFNFGRVNQIGPVPYSKLTNLLNLDPSFRFLLEVPIGSEVRVLSSKSPYTPPSSINRFHLTASSAGRLAAIDLLNQIAASGIPLEITVKYPNDVGLGNAGQPIKGSQKLSDILEIYAGDDIDNEVLEARNG